jgi:hypothetical protein
MYIHSVGAAPESRNIGQEREREREKRNKKEGGGGGGGGKKTRDEEMRMMGRVACALILFCYAGIMQR